MRIWIDGYEANVFERVGSGQVAFELLKNLEKIDTYNDYTILLPQKPLSDLPNQRKNWQYKILRPKRLWTRIALPLQLLTSFKKPNIFFSPTHYLPKLLNVKSVNTIFDLSPERFPEMFLKKDLYKLKNWTKESAKKADHIITISESSKKDIIKFYDISSQKITVAYPGYKAQVFYPIKDYRKINQIKDKYGIKKSRYIIFVGTIQPRKNLIRLIEAFKVIQDLKLVIVGKTKGEGRQAWMYDEILQKPKQLGIAEKIIFTGFVPETELPFLINGSVAFILPSLWEGFGIPVVDAMACGVPVIVSSISSLPEVVGDAGILINPNSVKEIQEAIIKIATDKKLWNRKSDASLHQAKKFSWEKMARVVLKVFEEVAKTK